jgi:predicted amidohydrolase
MTRIVCRQLAPKVGDFVANRAMSLAAITESVSAGADIVVLPELVTSGYVFASQEEAESVSVRPDHPIFAEWAAAAGSALVVGGFAEQGDDGLIYNSAACVDSSGMLAVYRKTHLWDREKLFFTPGPDIPPVVDTPVGRVAVLICYDLEFPELTRGVALAGAELIVVPTNWPLVPRPQGERAPEVIIGMAAARINHVAIACCDRTGVEREQEWTEGTTIIDENGWVVSTAGAGVGVASAELDLTLSRDKTLTLLGDAFGDRRPELYAALTAPRPVEVVQQ